MKNRLTKLFLMASIVFSVNTFASKVYTVKSGDSISKIAMKYNLDWKELAKINKLKNYKLIYPGQKIRLENMKEIQILHTNDMHGFFIEGKYDGMGAAKVKTVLETKKAENPDTLVLDAGDAMQGANLVTLSKGAKAVEVMNVLGYDAMAPGNHEFDYGLNQLMMNKKALNFPMLACNVKKADGSLLFKPYMIKEIDGVKVAVVGFATPETVFKSHPANTKGLTFIAPYDAARAVVKELKAKNVDLIIGVGHLGETGDYTAVTAATAGGIDVIIDGHSHATYPTGIVENNTLIASTGEKTKNVGVVTIKLDLDNNVISKEAKLVSKKDAKEITPNADMETLISNIKAENKKIESIVVGNTNELLQGERGFVRTGETNLGNLLTASLLDISGADVALTNGGGIRASIPVGEITKGEVLSVLPFGNTVKVIELSGADIKAALENGVTDYPKTKGAFPHIAGMEFTFDSSKEAGNKVVSIMIKGQAIDLNKSYTLVTNDFLAAGGDNYKMFKGKKIVAEFGAMDEVLIDYIAKYGTTNGSITNRIKEVNGVKPNMNKH